MNIRPRVQIILIAAALTLSTGFSLHAQSSTNEWTVPESENSSKIGIYDSEYNPSEDDNDGGHYVLNQGPPVDNASNGGNPPPPGLPINNWIPAFLLIAGVMGVHALKRKPKKA